MSIKVCLLGNLYKTTTNIQICSRFYEIFSTKFGMFEYFPYLVEIFPKIESDTILF